jgi:FkbM family methyltransferase
MIERNIKTSQQNDFTLKSNNVNVVEWFNNTENYTDIILKQINEERMYDPIFADRKDMVVLDLGANCGLFSLYAADSCSKLIAVEPTSSTFTVLEEIVRDHSNVTPLQLAIGPHNEMISFFINENSTTNSMLDRNGHEIKVQCMTLETLLHMQGLDHVDFIKCDIEGAEKYFNDVDFLGDCKQFSVEYHDAETKDIMMKKLQQWGFTIIDIFQLFNESIDRIGVINAVK